MVSRRPYKSDGSASPLVIDHTRLIDLLGRPTGKSKFMCVQFCLSVAQLAVDNNSDVESDKRIRVGGDINSQIVLNIDSVERKKIRINVNGEKNIQEVIQNGVDRESEGEGERERERIGEGEGEGIVLISRPDLANIADVGKKREGGGGEIAGGEEVDDGVEDDLNSVMTPSVLLEAAKVAALKGLNDRSGVASVGNAMILFINCFDTGGADRAPASMRKYANQFLIDGQYFTWFVDARRWAGKNI